MGLNASIVEGMLLPSKVNPWRMTASRSFGYWAARPTVWMEPYEWPIPTTLWKETPPTAPLRSDWIN